MGAYMAKFLVIPNFPDYLADSLGNIWKVVGKKKTKVKIFKDKEGYRHAAIKSNNKSTLVRVAPLILKTFTGGKPKGKQCSHKNSKRSDDRLCNLAWKTASEDYLDKIKNGTHFKGSKNPRAKLTEKNVIKIRKLKLLGLTNKTLSFQFEVDERTIGRIVQYKTWTHIS